MTMSSINPTSTPSSSDGARHAEGSVSRRAFLAGAGALVAATSASGAMGARPALASKASDSEDAPDGGYVTSDPAYDETIDADVVVMGAGMSGTAAALQASELGASVVVLEANDATGGNGQLTEGIAAIDSSMSKELGIEIDPAQIVHDELEFFNYRVNALFWMDAIRNSGENLDWMIDNGAQFDGTVDDDRGNGNVRTFHWFKDRMGVNATQPLLDKAAANGAQVLCGTRGRQLVMSEGKVSGIVAERSDGTRLLVRCKAVIFASGGYGANYDLMVARGCPTVFYDKCNAANRGDALLMAKAAGGVDVTANSALLFSVTIPSLSFLESFFLQTFGQALLVNEKGERFTDESCGKTAAIGCYLNTISLQKETYAILSPAILDVMEGQKEGMRDKIVSACTGRELATESSSVDAIGGDQVQDSVLGTLYGVDGEQKTAFWGSTVEELAESIGIDAETLKATVERYDSLCAEGSDRDFGKPSELMTSLGDAEEYYALRVYPGYATSIGGIKTDRNAQVVDAHGEPVPGLYAVGCDGAMTYRETYTIEVPGSCNMNNVNSGRVAARHAVANL